MRRVDELILVKKYGINPEKIRFLLSGDVFLDVNQKAVIIEKLLEAKELAFLNLKKGNITRRAFGANIYCVSDSSSFWSIGTNFNNTRNDISSICAERSAIVNAYNNFLKQNIKEFKIKYIAMAQAVELSEIKDSIIPCEDCLSWFNTERFLDDNTVVFTFERQEEELIVKSIKLKELLPFKGVLTSNILAKDVIYSKKADELKNKIDAFKLIKKAQIAYEKNKLANISNQNITCTILTNKKIYTASKIDWTRRWFVEPLELAASKALENEKKLKIRAIAYFGDEIAKTDQGEFADNVVSIKSLGRIRQKWADNDTLLILNFEGCIQVITLSEYLPKKFIQGYKIV